MALLGRKLGLIGGLGVPALIAAGAQFGFRERVRQGQNPAFAAAIEGGTLAGHFLLSTPAQLSFFLGIPAARVAGQLITQSISDHNRILRQARTPFSHRFEHTDVSARAQSVGMRQIGAAWGHAHMGSEASLFSRRYMR